MAASVKQRKALMRQLAHTNVVMCVAQLTIYSLAMPAFQLAARWLLQVLQQQNPLLLLLLLTLIWSLTVDAAQKPHSKQALALQQQQEEENRCSMSLSMH
jgi:hypothetical protein